jgi:hypothetical protein
MLMMSAIVVLSSSWFLVEHDDSRVLGGRRSTALRSRGRYNNGDSLTRLFESGLFIQRIIHPPGEFVDGEPIVISRFCL